MLIIAENQVGFLVEIAVAPLAGAWIEISTSKEFKQLPFVAPLAGAWIEIISGNFLKPLDFGRSPRGSVD